MKRIILLFFVLLLVAAPVFAHANLVNDKEGLLSWDEAASLEEIYTDFAQTHEFAAILVTTDSFSGRSAENYAGDYYDMNGYGEDGILYLVSLSEGEWYILTNGQCYHRISNADTQRMGDILVEYLRDGEYYEAFARFPELAEDAFYDSIPGEESVSAKRNYSKTILISMIVGFAIAGIAVGIMAYQMKSVRQQHNASDYVRSGSMQIRDRRDIFLYSHVSRTPKPKSNSSGSSGGGNRGGSGGRI